MGASSIWSCCVSVELQYDPTVHALQYQYKLSDVPLGQYPRGQSSHAPFTMYGHWLLILLHVTDTSPLHHGVTLNELKLSSNNPGGTGRSLPYSASMLSDKVTGVPRLNPARVSEENSVDEVQSTV
jgi:hypothetical protein